MRAAMVTTIGEPPQLGSFAVPVPEAGERLIRVTAAAMSHLTVRRASGSHYSSGGALPFVPGVDGVGRLDDGRRCYFVMPRAPFGAMAEWSVAADTQLVPLPDGLGDAEAAALANPAMSAWAALTDRARLQAGETVLVNGVTGTSGRLAVRIARHLGAGRVLGAARDRAALDALVRTELDAIVPLGAADTDAALAQAYGAGIDVVLDYLWGEPGAVLLQAAATHGGGRRTRHVEIGAAAGATLPLSGAVLRASGLELLGSGLGSVSDDRLVAGIGAALVAAAAGALGPDRGGVAFRPAPFDAFDVEWSRDDPRRRTVFVMD